MARRPIIVRQRWRAHLALGAATVAGCWLTHAIQPGFPLVLTLTIGLGYLALLFLALGLGVGPLQLWRRPRNPVNLYLRRDLGLWTGLTGSAHVVLGLQTRAGGQIAPLFFDPAGGLLFNLFGLSNDLGALATAILLALTGLSNDWSLRRLKGPRWKAWQRLNYLLFPLVIAHTLGYQALVARDPVMGPVVDAVAVGVLVLQGWGIYRYRASRAWRAQPPATGRRA